MKRLTLAVFAVGILFLIITFIFSLVIKEKNNPTVPASGIPTPTPIIGSTPFVQIPIDSPLEKTVIDNKTSQDIQNIEGISATSSANNIITYTFPSVNALIPNEIQTQYGKVIYERTSTYTSAPGGFPSLSEYTAKLGTPERVIQGNTTYGPSAIAYLFPKKGYVMIGNPITNEMYEIQRFVPISLIEYLRRYGNTVQEAEQNQP